MSVRFGADWRQGWGDFLAEAPGQRRGMERSRGIRGGVLGIERAGQEGVKGTSKLGLRGEGKTGG
jgi:hypothetical protein